MKEIFVCEYCGEQYIDKNKAIACEKAHVAEAEKQERLAKEKQARRNAIGKMLEEYQKDYNEPYSDVTILKGLDSLYEIIYGKKRNGHLG